MLHLYKWQLNCYSLTNFIKNSIMSPEELKEAIKKELKTIENKETLESTLQFLVKSKSNQNVYDNIEDHLDHILETDENLLKRGYILMRSILMANNVDLMASEDEKYNFTIKVAEGKMDVEENTIWIENNIIPLKKN